MTVCFACFADKLSTPNNGGVIIMTGKPQIAMIDNRFI
jgi:hypothetical protein